MLNIYLILAFFTLAVLMLIINYVLAKYKLKYFKITMPITIAIFVYIFSMFDAIYHDIDNNWLGIPMSIIAFLITYFCVKGMMNEKDEKKNSKKK